VSHYDALFAGYLMALTGWLVLARYVTALRSNREPCPFQHPWREVGWAIAACVAVLIVGQVYQRGWLLPTGNFRPVAESLNHCIIFSPFFFLLFFRKQPLTTAWIPDNRIALRLATGIGLALAAITVYLIVRPDNPPIFAVLLSIIHPKNLPMAVQVLLEDVAIAILLVRFRAAIGLHASVLLVACLFAAGHIPAMLTESTPWSEFAHLILDAGIAAAAITVLYRSADISWFWCVHYAMDMMQFQTI